MNDVLDRNKVTSAENLGSGERGNLLQAVLTGSWRQAPPVLSLTAGELAQITPLLLRTGAGALGWWRVRSSDLRTTPAAEQLHDAYRYYSLQATLGERQVKQVVARLRSARVEPLLANGWAVSRLYAEPGLRPYKRVDLLVHPDNRSAALDVLEAFGGQYFPMNLHRGFAELEDRTLDELYRRSRLVRLGEMDLRVLGPEDQLRMLCLRQFLMGGRRPQWRCDIGAVLESLPEDFDWDYCFGGDGRRSDWVACVLRLAHRIVGAPLDEAQISKRARRLPRWLIPAVNEQLDLADVRGSYLSRWQEEWRTLALVSRVGTKTVICPTNVNYVPRQSDVVILEKPALAFGRGHHPTTRMCLEESGGSRYAWDEGCRPRDRRWDPGPSSG